MELLHRRLCREHRCGNADGQLRQRLSSRNGWLGYTATGTGVATVDGAGSTWTNTGPLYIGYYGTGTLNITNGGAVNSGGGSFSGSGSTVTVDGTGSQWNNNIGFLNVNGTLNISNGGAVTATGTTDVIGSTGAINFGTAGGTLTTHSLYASPTQLTGTGTINTHGLVSDANLLFDGSDPSHGAVQTVSGFGSVAVNLDVSNPSAAGDLGAGYLGNSALAIRNGITVYSNTGLLGTRSNSMGVATVDGASSTWNISNALDVGGLDSGSGTLNVTNGGIVSSATCQVSYSGSIVTVDGPGSHWTNSSDLYIGYFGDHGPAAR